MRLTPRKTGQFTKESYLSRAVGLSIIAATFKAILLAFDVFPFNADEAIVGLMARHTLQGQWSTFFYGQAYMGSLDATLVAIGFQLFGQEVITIRVIQVILYSLTVLTTAILGKLIFRSERVGLLGAILLTIPTVNTTLYTTISLGGYGEALLIGNLLLIIALKFSDDGSLGWIAAWGFLSGFGFWAFGITMVFIFPSAILLVYNLAHRGGKERALGAVFTLIGFLIGAMPLVLWGIDNGFGILWSEVFGSAIAGASSSNFLLAVYEHVLNFILFGFTVLLGLRPPWTTHWLAAPLIPVALGFWLAVFGLTIQNLRRQDPARVGRWLLIGVVFTLIAGFILTPFGADPSGRYFLPLLVPMALFAGEVITNIWKEATSRLWIWVCIAAILGFNLWGTIQSASIKPPGITTQFDSVTWIDHSYDEDLVRFLEEVNATRGYSNYWVAYPIAFLSSEDIVFIPKLPYHEDFRFTERDNRYAEYDELVTESDQVAYITTNHHEMDEKLRSNFESAGISWQEEWVGNYHVFYGLSSKITPEDMAIQSWAEDQGEDR
jgi:4-amino-4-deoxy-L-arabinose transferase-like glycosyltransferase